jgi:polyisoprenoid-binding protein YceI
MSRVCTAFIVFLALTVAPGVLAQPVSRDVLRAPNGTYQLETSHSQILFSVLHIGLTDYYGRFDKISGQLNLDANQPERSAVSISIDTSSVDTPSARTADELKSSSVFDVEHFPTASFRSTSIARTGANTGRITGDLTIRNVTRPVALDVIFNGGELNPLNDTYAVGFRATTTIKRSDFGMTSAAWSSLVSDDVQLIIEAMFQHQKG